MRKNIALFLLLSLCGYAAAQEWEVSAGPAYAFYGIRAETSAVNLDSQYGSLGADLGVTCRLTPEWEVRGSLFLGMPVVANVLLDSGASTEPDLSLYDLYRYYLNFTIGPSYIMKGQSWSVSVGPMIVFNDFVLASQYNDPSYVLSYTMGAGAQSRFQYRLGDWLLYADVKGAYNFCEMLVEHDDYSYAYLAQVSLGAVWRVK